MNNANPDVSLPRLLYLGDVPVESSYHGSTLLYRLLETYPKDRLQIVEAGLHASLPARRLDGVPYHFRPLPVGRLQNSRLASWYATGNVLQAERRSRKFQALMDNFRPEAVLTVTNGVSWITAAAVARERDIPLHLICHDEWVDSFPSLPVVKNWKEQIFRKIYQAAASRLCVSPSMIEKFTQRYGAGGTLLYPSRAMNAASAQVPAERLHRRQGGLIVAYAGSVYSSGPLRQLAECLESIDGRLLIFAPGRRDHGVFADLDLPNVSFRGLLDSRELIARLRDEADVLFVPMSFLPSDRANMEICFPSKLTDYTAVGLPILIHGPEYGSAIRWARENPGVAEVVFSEEAALLTEALKQLAAGPGHLISTAQRGIEAGKRYFSHEKAWEIFRETLLSPGPAAVSGIK